MNNKKIGIYVQDDRFEPIDLKRLNEIDFINLSFAKIKDGLIDCSHLTNINTITELVKFSVNTKAIVSIGGYGCDGFSEMASSSKSRSKFIMSVMHFLKKYNLDGIDLDWEYPTYSFTGNSSSLDDGENFILLLKELNEALNYKSSKTGKKYYLSIAAGAGDFYFDAVDMYEVSKYVDWINLMTYDFRVSMQMLSGHHSNLYINPGDPVRLSINTVIRRLEKTNLPLKKIIIGIPFYGVVWRGMHPFIKGINRPCEFQGKETKDFSYIMEEYILNGSMEEHFDNDAKVPYLLSGTTMVSYDNPRSIMEKGKYIKQKNLGGMMCWEYPIDYNHMLFDAMVESLK